MHANSELAQRMRDNFEAWRETYFEARKPAVMTNDPANATGLGDAQVNAWMGIAITALSFGVIVMAGAMG